MNLLTILVWQTYPLINTNLNEEQRAELIDAKRRC